MEEKMKIDFLLNDEDRKDVEQWVKELEESKDLEIGQNITSGGLKVTFDEQIGNERIFVIDREIGTIIRPIAQKSTKPSKRKGA